MSKPEATTEPEIDRESLAEQFQQLYDLLDEAFGTWEALRIQLSEEIKVRGRTKRVAKPGYEGLFDALQAYEFIHPCDALPDYDDVMNPNGGEPDDL